MNRTIISSKARGLGGSAITYARTPGISMSLVNNLSAMGTRVDCDYSGAKALRPRVNRVFSFHFVLNPVPYIGIARMFFERFSFFQRVCNGDETCAAQIYTTALRVNSLYYKNFC